MGVHRTSIYKQKKVVDLDKYRFYEKEEDEEVLRQIQAVLKQRPSYGYKRITALINKDRSQQGLEQYNKKRILRVMRKNNLILPKITGQSYSDKKTGKVMTLKSNLRWCSDCFEIKCFNGEKVYVAFSLDTCDREIISYIAKPQPILAEDIELLMIESVESRFEVLNTPHRIQWLTDRGSVYRAYSTQLMARKLGLECCYTMAYSPQSNGMAEAFVGRFKQDYVYMNDVENAKVTIDLIKEWINDYNENAPHSALNMKSPREFMRLREV